VRIYSIISLLICIGFSQNVDSLKIVLKDLDNKKELLSENLVELMVSEFLDIEFGLV
jgi:hypothetical protein